MHTTLRQVHVRVPATTANLGSGFDILGLALQLYNVFTLTITSEPGWRVSLPPGTHLPRNDRNLVFRAARVLFTQVGVTPPGLHLSLAMHIPLARGLGSSSSAIVGGLMAANQLTGNRVDRQALLAMAVAIEGHPDNVTPALMGGLTLSYTIEAQHHYTTLPFPPELTLVVAVPDFELSTAQARAVLPTQVDRTDAVFNCGRTALFVHALHSRQYALLATAMDDRLHQPYRAALVPGMAAAIAAGYAAGAHGVALSGAGPALLAIAETAPDAVAHALQEAFAHHGVTCSTRLLYADTTGAVAWEGLLHEPSFTPLDSEPGA
jgi:homoserine kinase